MYRPRPANGSGDSPRPPFLSEFVNHIGKLSLVEVVYHLFGGTLATRVHPHIERSIRLKTESACCVVKLQAADADVRKQALGPQTLDLSQTCKRSLHQRNRRPIGYLTPGLVGRGLRSEVRGQLSDGGSRKPNSGNLQRCRVLIEPNQMSRCAEAFCDFVTVPAKAHRGVDIRPATPHV